MNISLSVNDLLACCGFLCGQGCNGGYPISAWRYFKHHGVVTGECDPYFDNTGCSHPGCEPAYPTPKCVRKCVSGNQLWRESKHYGVSAYKVRHDPQDIMADVYKNGPVEVAFTVYEDFAHYKYGMYKHITGDNIGGHAVKLIGWGTSDDGEDYWLLANQWNRSWGDLMETNIMRSLMGCTSFTPSVLIQKGAIIPRRCIRHLCLRTAESARGSSSDAAMVIDKQKVAVDILHEIRTEVSRMKESIGMVPGLAVLHVGDTKLSTPYWAPCGFVGIRSFEVHLAEDTTEEKTLECVSSFNDDPCVHGILVELPLPTHMDEHKILNAVSIEKDKGFHPLNIGLLAMRGREPFFLPQTPKACIELLHRNNIEIKGKRAVVIGRSNTFGIPAALLLQREDATVTIIHSKTKNPQDITRQADIIISAVGKPNMVRGSWIKPGAVIVDVGISFVRDRNAPDGFRWVGGLRSCISYHN